MSTDLVIAGEGSAVAHGQQAPAMIETSVEELVSRARKIQQAMEAVMVEGVHYGRIPGVPKPSLFLAGAEKLNLLFMWAPTYHSEPVAPDLGAGWHLTIKSICTLTHIPTGLVVASAEGSCSTREVKYAYREATRKCPACGKAAIIKGKQEFGGGWLCWKKKEGCGAKYAEGDPQIESQPLGRVPNEDIADAYNTVLKQSNKRALTSAVRNASGASDVFTSDVEDMPQFEASSTTTLPTAPPPSAAESARIPSTWVKAGAKDSKGKVIPHPYAGRAITEIPLDALGTIMEGLRADVAIPGKAKDAKHQPLLEAIENEFDRQLRAQTREPGEDDQ